MPPAQKPSNGRPSSDTSTIIENKKRKQESENFRVVKSAPIAKKTKLTTEERFQQIQQARKSLPIYDARESLIEEIRKNKTLVIVGETGSGKTTRKSCKIIR